jgi:hypothetical protein
MYSTSTLSRAACLLLLTLPLASHGYERGAFVPKDPPLMPTIVVYSGDKDSSDYSHPPASETATIGSSDANAAPAPVSAPAADATPAPAPVAQPAPAPVAAVSPLPSHLKAAPSAADEASHLLRRLIFLVLGVSIGIVLFLWLRRPYTPPHDRQSAAQRAADSERWKDDRDDV